MDANSTKQQTLSEFMAPAKSARIWQIIFAVLLSLMILGAVYEFTKPAKEPVRMSTLLSSDTYSYVDATLVSGWLVKVTGDTAYTYYEVLDTDGNWFITDIDDATYATLSAQTAGYDPYFTDYADNPQDFPMPEAVRLTGITRALSSSDYTDLASVFAPATADEVSNFYGPTYLQVGVNDQSSGAMLYLVGAFVFGLLLLVITLQTGSQKKSYKKSEERLYELGLLDAAEAEFSSPDAIRYPKSKLVLSQQFIFCGSTGWMLPYTDIGWAYQRTQRSYGIPVAKMIIAGLVNGKSITLANRFVNDDVLTKTAQAIYTANPNCLIGYSFDNIKTYNQRVKEYKQNHPK
jgi:hypothetical protein